MAIVLPEELKRELAQLLGSIESATPLGGGCISSALRLVCGETAYFLKYDDKARPGFFTAEAAGLAGLRAASEQIQIPEVIAHRDNDAGWSWILLEWLPAGAKVPGFWPILGRGLARIHKKMGPRWGWDRNGFIGRLPQSNDPTTSWADFWWTRRLAPQLERARAATELGTPADWHCVEDALPRLLAVAEEEGPSLLHGDLWSGNVLTGRGGPALFDPACYCGHREVDLAMADLFGGFDPSFFAAYSVEWPLQPGAEIRRRVYQLYYLLVHVNLFGAGYAAPTMRTVREILDQT